MYMDKSSTLGRPPYVDFTSTLRPVLVWIWIRVSKMVIVFIFSLLIRRLPPVFPFSKSNSASQCVHDDWQRPTSIVDLTSRVPCQFFYFCRARQPWAVYRQLSVSHYSHKRKKHQQTDKTQNFFALDLRWVSSLRIACVRRSGGDLAGAGTSLPT